MSFAIEACKFGGLIMLFLASVYVFAPDPPARPRVHFGWFGVFLEVLAFILSGKI